MPFTETSQEGQPVVYLGIEFSLTDSGSIRMREYRKDQAYPFHIIRYPHRNSNVPTSQGNGVYFSQLIRLGEITNNLPDYKDSVQCLTARMMARGHPIHELKPAWRKYLHNYWNAADIEDTDLSQWWWRMTKYLQRTGATTTPTPTRPEISHQYIPYGQPGGGQRAAECGWLITKWLCEHHKLAAPLREDLDAAARNLEKEEAKTWPKAWKAQYYNGYGNYDITTLIKILQPYGTLEYWKEGNTADAYIIAERCRKQKPGEPNGKQNHYTILLPHNRRWRYCDSTRKPSWVYDLQDFLSRTQGTVLQFGLKNHPPSPKISPVDDDTTEEEQPDDQLPETSSNAGGLTTAMLEDLDQEQAGLDALIQAGDNTTPHIPVWGANGHQPHKEEDEDRQSNCSTFSRCSKRSRDEEEPHDTTTHTGAQERHNMANTTTTGEDDETQQAKRRRAASVTLPRGHLPIPLIRSKRSTAGRAASMGATTDREYPSTSSNSTSTTNKQPSAAPQQK